VSPSPQAREFLDAPPPFWTPVNITDAAVALALLLLAALGMFA
jgi:hypothetical protein